MKYISILRMHPGTELQAEALKTFLAHGPVEGTEWLLASTSSKIYISLGSADTPDIAGLATYAPFFDVETIPVVDVDEAWVNAMQESQSRRV